MNLENGQVWTNGSRYYTIVSVSKTRVVQQFKYNGSWNKHYEVRREIMESVLLGGKYYLVTDLVKALI